MHADIVPAPEGHAPGGHYSQAVKAAGLIFISGQLGIRRNDPRDKSVQQQIEDVLTALEAILNEAGATLQDVVKINLYVDDIAHWDAIDAIYKTVFGDHRPARIIVPAKGLHYGSALELDAVAIDRAM